ncbi:MAG TPA: hypothetical protein VMX55_04825 [candidate division Zixibacteria bacterium]|nr:hypothetical protein [candidate division Zixibacteria bacterium]
MLSFTQEQIIQTDSLHLAEKFNHITVEKIAKETEFLVLINRKEKAVT